MCIGSAWKASRIRSGIMGMENIRPGKRTLAGLPILADMLNHHAEIGFHVDEKLGDLVQAPFERVQTRPRRLVAAGDWLACPRRPDAVEHLVKVLWLPAKRYGQRRQRARATAALNGVTLDLPDGRQRHVRTFRKFALAPSKLSYALIDGLGDGGVFLRGVSCPVVSVMRGARGQPVCPVRSRTE